MDFPHRTGSPGGRPYPSSVTKPRCTALTHRAHVVATPSLSRSPRRRRSTVGTLVCNAAAQRTIILPPAERRRKPRGCDVVLTGEERIALNGKVTGLVEREIAVELHASVPTVERILRGLRDKLGVATTCALCAKAVSLGLVTLDE